jgi:hypothetical protein
MSIFYVLICIASLVLKSPVSLNIHNRCQNISLISPVYFIRGGKWHVVLDQEIDIDAVMRNCIEFDFRHDTLEGALVYKIQREHVGSDKSVQNESKYIQLLVAWHVEHTKGLHVRALLVEYDRELDKRKLWTLHQKYWHLLNTQINPIKSNWRLNDATLLKTKVKAMNGGCRWDIFISKGAEYVVERPLWIDTKRQVVIMLMIFLVLTDTVSLTLHKVMAMTVHNEDPDIELVSPVYFCTGGTYYEYPVERSDVGVMIKLDFRFDPDQDESGGALMYEMRRKGSIESDRQASIEPIYAKVIEDASKMMRLLVIWKIKYNEEPKSSVILVKYGNEFVLNEDKLAQLYNKVNVIPINCYESTWLIRDDTVPEVMRKVVWRRNHELEIIVSKGFRDSDTIRPMWIDSERQVSPLITTCTNLHASLTIQSEIDMTINNQCTSIELSSPVYFTKGATCHIPFLQPVNSKSIMKIKFVTGVDRDTFGGALLYRLQWKGDVPTSTQLLVIWGCRSNKTYFHALYLHVWLIEHENTFVWDKDKLEMLYDEYDDHWYTKSDLGIWLLNDNIELKTNCKALHGGYGMEINISKNKNMLFPMEPLWVDPNR